MKMLRLILVLASLNAFAQNDYFFPGGVTFDPAIPTPEQFLGYPVGDWHTRHDRIVAYFQELARVSPKARITVIGYTYERRPQVVLTITNTDNHARLEEIRLEHLKLATPAQSPNIASMPVVVTHGYNVHGNEPSSSEAAMLTAYYLIAAQGAEAERTLREGVIHIDPNYNPDGRDRHSNWANMHKSFPPVADPADREHNEVWPGGRFNHYWFDLNRDWLPLAHVESRNRVAFFHQWLPNVCTDYHEMGTSGTNFFEPTKQFGSENPVVPRSNYDQLNPLFAKYFSKALDDIGSLYFSKEVFDNSYPGYGSTYPDIHGGLGLVFEQASSRGHAQQSATKVVTFAFTIRNHVRTSLATVKAAVENRELLLKHQQDFFKTALDEGKKSPIKVYVIGDSKDAGRTRAFGKLLLLHQVETYQLNADITLGKTRFEKGKAYVVPLDQTQSRIVRSLFEKVTQFQDSVFYDASTWTMAVAYGLPYEASNSAVTRGDRLTQQSLATPAVSTPKAAYAYIIDWSEYSAPKALYAMLKNDLYVKNSYRQVTVDINGVKRTFGAGSLVVSVADQNLPADDVHRIVSSACADAGIQAFGINSGLTGEGTNLGSGSIRAVTLPRVALVVGDGVAATEAGFTWFQMDSKLEMPVTKISSTQFNSSRLSDYNVLIMVSGNYSTLGEPGATKIKTWVQQGGTLILQKTAITWAIQNKIIDEVQKKDDDKEKEPTRLDFATSDEYQGSRAIGGSIYMTDLDITHPLGFGYSTRSVPVWRNHTIFLEPSKNAVNTVSKCTTNPLLSGYVHRSNLEKIKNSPSLIVSNVGQGRAILFIDDPNFRAYWYGTSKLFFNAIFFGSQIGSTSFDEEH